MKYLLTTFQCRAIALVIQHEKSVHFRQYCLFLGYVKNAGASTAQNKLRKPYIETVIKYEGIHCHIFEAYAFL